eukprot:11162598-Lingulodinium_polyedra.AAC.1
MARTSLVQTCRRAGARSGSGRAPPAKSCSGCSRAVWPHVVVSAVHSNQHPPSGTGLHLPRLIGPQR